MPESETQNKRKYPRAKVPKSALVAWKNGSQKTVSPVENLALGGLFIRTKTPASVGTTLQLVFNTPQGEVRVRAVVRMVRPGEGMGVGIASMEQEDRGRLDRWLRQLTPQDDPMPGPR
jgi:PilZ domain.